MQLAFRTSKEVGVLDLKSYSPPPHFQPDQQRTIRIVAYSPDGGFIAYADPEQVHLLRPDGQVQARIPQANVYDVGFSPRGSFVITWERAVKDGEGNTLPNLHVWRTSPDAERVASFVQKSQSGWNLQYTEDEAYCARLVSNEVQFYEGGVLDKVWSRLRVEGATDFYLSPGGSPSVAVFIPERKGAPASVRVYTLPDLSQPVSQKQFFKADKVQCKWNAIGTSLLLLTQTDVDKTGKSYYGETNLYLLCVAAKYDARITLDKEGPIHDVVWSPDSQTFGVVYGYMPAKTVLFNGRGNVAHTLPSGPRNCIKFSPQARFIVVAGFGNLQGQMDVYDADREYRKLATIEAHHASFCEWGPDGRTIMTATTSPRLRVDNGFRLWHYTGDLVYQAEMHELYQVAWRPLAAHHFPPRSLLSPPPAPHESAISGKRAVSKASGAYRPPHARNSPTPPQTLRELEASGRYGSNGVKQLPPGAAVPEDPLEPLSRAALKNKKKREAKKKDADEESAANGPSAANGAMNGVTANGTADGTNGNGVEDKKTRGLLKKLRAIEELKMRLAHGDKLEETQMKKIQTEEVVREELHAVGWRE